MQKPEVQHHLRRTQDDEVGNAGWSSGRARAETRIDQMRSGKLFFPVDSDLPLHLLVRGGVTWMAYETSAAQPGRSREQIAHGSCAHRRGALRSQATPRYHEHIPTDRVLNEAARETAALPGPKRTAMKNRIVKLDRLGEASGETLMTKRLDDNSISVDQLIEGINAMIPHLAKSGSEPRSPAMWHTPSFAIESITV